MRNTAPDFFKINPDGSTTLRMPVIPTIRLLFVIRTNAPFLLHIIEARPLLEFYFRGEENFAGGKFRGRKISRNSIRSGYYFRGREFRAKSQFANLAKISSSRKIGVMQYCESSFRVIIANNTMTSNRATFYIHMGWRWKINPIGVCA